MEGGVRTAPGVRYSLRNFDAKSSSRATIKPLTIKNSNFLPEVSSLSFGSSMMSSNSLPEGDDDDTGVEFDARDGIWSFCAVMEAMILRELGDENSHFGSGAGVGGGGIGVAVKVFRRVGPSMEETDPLRRLRADMERGRSFTGDGDAGAGELIFLVQRTETNPLVAY